MSTKSNWYRTMKHTVEEFDAENTLRTTLELETQGDELVITMKPWPNEPDEHGFQITMPYKDFWNMAQSMEHGAH